MESATACTARAIQVTDVKYISDNIPGEFKREDLGVCAGYDLYEDMRFCVCCGGVRVIIKPMKYFIR